MLRSRRSNTTIEYVKEPDRITILGVTGVASIADLASMILALLTVLALSQIRSRRQVAAIANAQRADPFSLLAAEFPADLVKLRA
jgi:hypothetical protein